MFKKAKKLASKVCNFAVFVFIVCLAILFFYDKDTENPSDEQPSSGITITLSDEKIYF